MKSNQSWKLTRHHLWYKDPIIGRHLQNFVIEEVLESDSDKVALIKNNINSLQALLKQEVFQHRKNTLEKQIHDLNIKLKNIQP